MANFIKDPDATLDYTVDWSLWLGTDGISSSQWFVSVGCGGIAISSQSHTQSGATVVVSGGTAGSAYAITNRIVTSGAMIDDRTIHLDILEK